MQDYKNELKRIIKIFLDKKDEYSELKMAADNLYQLFLTASGMQEQEKKYRKDVYLPNGKAIGTVWAAMCVREMMRTKKFIFGIYNAIKYLQKNFPYNSIHIVYAGTGPFAALVIPLTSVFSSKEVQFTLLEINTDTIQILKNTIRAFQVEDYVNEIVQCDAAEYKANIDKPIHMVISETMQNALQKEPQVSIARNLVPQIQEGGIFIPQNISVEVALIDSKRDRERMMGVEGAEHDYYYSLGKIFELNKNTAIDDEYLSRKVDVIISKNIEARYSKLCLLTDIQVFRETKLTNYQCSLTIPKRIMNIDLVNSPVKKIKFQYIINEKPGFAWEIKE